VPVDSRGRRYSISPGQGGVYHIYPGGQRVWKPYGIGTFNSTGSPAAPAQAKPTSPFANPAFGGQGVGWPGQPGFSGQPGKPPQAGPGQQPSQPAAQPSALTPDATFLANMARAAFERQQQVAALESQDKTDRTDTDEAIRRILSTRDPSRRNITSNANRSGLLYSSHLNRELDDFETGLTRQQGDIQTDFGRRTAAREAARAALEAGAPLEEAAEMAALADRRIDRDQAWASVNGLALNPGARPPAAAPTPVQPRAQAPVAVAKRPQRTTRPRRRQRR
jgi:hypothetical protein